MSIEFLMGLDISYFFFSRKIFNLTIASGSFFFITSPCFLLFLITLSSFLHHNVIFIILYIGLIVPDSLSIIIYLFLVYTYVFNLGIFFLTLPHDYQLLCYVLFHHVSFVIPSLALVVVLFTLFSDFLAWSLTSSF